MNIDHRNEACRQAHDLIEQRRFDEALDVLRQSDHPDQTGEAAALAGLALFHLERYDEAATEYSRAVAVDPRDAWTTMQARCAQNATARVDVYVPPIHYLDRQALLGAPETPRLPDPPPPHHVGFGERFRLIVGRGIGAAAVPIWEFATRVVGRRYSDRVWTNWYRRHLYASLLTLTYMRDKLNRENLFSPYPKGARVGFLAADALAPRGATHFRTADGSWNNLAEPKEGAAGTRFPRNVASDSIRPATGDELLSPNPRLISRTLLTRDDGIKEVPFLNLLAASWIQFMNHDWISHGENVTTEMIEIPIDDDDPARLLHHQKHMFVARTQPDPTYGAHGPEQTPITFANEVTHWWDGSQIYGSDQATQDRLRSGVDGKLRITDQRTLPVNPNGVEDTGFVRNWWVGLSMFHNLFVLEHNAICNRLKSRHSNWTDDRLFNVARLINAAVMAKIHSVEWTPAILPNPGLNTGLNANWYGILTYRFQPEGKRKTVAEYNITSPELGGLVGNHINKHGAAFGLAEEFVEIYRLHSLLPESLVFRRHATGAEIEDLPFVESRQAGSPKVIERVGLVDLFYSFGNQHPGQLALNNYPRFMQELSIPGNPVFDMGAVDILRARERGVPRYNEFRRQLGLHPMTCLEDLTSDPDALEKLRAVYGDDIESIDLMVGTLAEETRPYGFGFGETMFQIFILNASRRLQADRFYTDDYRPEVYTTEGMQWIDDATLKSVLLRHFPELERTGLVNIKNAFEPWDVSPVLDPQRHPLRRFDPDLATDPWLGDAVAGRPSAEPLR